jgi:hypothetical protein
MSPPPPSVTKRALPYRPAQQPDGPLAEVPRRPINDFGLIIDPITGTGRTVQG